MPLNANNQYVPPSVSGYFAPDLGTFGAPNPTTGLPDTKANFTSRVVSQSDEGTLIQWRVILETFAGGYGPNTGSFNQLYNRYISTTRSEAVNPTMMGMEARYDGYLTPSVNGGFEFDASISSTHSGLHWAYAFDTLMMGVGSAANHAMFKESSTAPTTNSVVDTLTFSPAAVITCMERVIVGGATAAEQVMIGYKGANAARLMTNNTGSLNATSMHADTQSCWGVIQAPTVNSTYTNPLWIYSNGQLAALSSTSAVGTQPTATLTAVPNGGFHLGLLRLAGGPLKAAWVWPSTNNSNGILNNDTNVWGKVITTDIETGTTANEIPMGLTRIRQAVLVNGYAVIATDGDRIMLYDGRTAARDLGYGRNRMANSNIRFRARGLMVRENQLYVLSDVNDLNRGAATALVDVCDLNTGLWHASNDENSWYTGSNGFPTYPTAGGLPLSPKSNFFFYVGVHNLASVDTPMFGGHFAPPQGVNTAEVYYKTPGSITSVDDRYTVATGELLTPAWELPGLEGWPKTISRVIFGGDLDRDATAATCTVSFINPEDHFNEGPQSAYTATGVTATFVRGQRNRAQLFEQSEQSYFYKLQMKISLTTTDLVPVNALPLIIEGYCFIGAPEPPPYFIQDVR